MSKIQLTREIAQAIATDVGNRSMYKGGRVYWSKQDYRRAARALNRLMRDGEKDDDDEWEE
jgi:hypothetical protein